MNIYMNIFDMSTNYKNFNHSTAYYKKIDHVCTIYHFLTICIIFHDKRYNNILI